MSGFAASARRLGLVERPQAVDYQVVAGRIVADELFERAMLLVENVRLPYVEAGLQDGRP